MPLPARLIAGLFTAVLLSGQSLRVAPSQTARSMPGILTVDIESPLGKAPAALQWDIAIPPAILVRLADIRIGKAAEASHKTLSCAASVKKSAGFGGVRYTCILAGGDSPLENGPVAQLQYRLQTDVYGAPIRVAIENVLATSADLKSLTIESVNAIIHIR
jgi:hypothetical protein